ncbi:O-acetylhomoserine aminocarboxypropyltransferase/cysteine synthase [Agromyces intestinalis]|uniref:O-acetylhomoserine aminocarboxypropyltransferase/cysteine synthase n=1 Tax=Agromyces intestinalis TaxID=2592652 RepID=A0A5C1YFS6_9MICO|nr:aminotransferase class I/II-fold pyridoxal phosphate-dependent enzyme [Agromyces intestinalis]QEO13869.1 O-acetylhomoserine aminocarboxypropyltransferase/cysteine synthase [Agromyces intestinalis]
MGYPSAHDDAAFATRQVHAGESDDAAFGARITPIYLSAGFRFDDFAEARDRFAGEAEGYVYTRSGNPTNAALERRIAGLEGGRDAVVVASGQAALTVSVLSVVGAGDHVLSAQSIYSGTRSLFSQAFGRLGIEVEFIDDPRDLGEWRRRLRPTTRALYTESIANPTNEVADLAGIAAVAHQAGVPLIVDNTLATPYLVRPIEHGADLVVHSASKFLSGHGAALGGVIIDAGTFDWAARPGAYPHLTRPDDALHGRSYVEAHGDHALTAYVREVTGALFGPVLSPVNAFLIQQGIETLSLRVQRQSSTALEIAAWLERQPEVRRVDYAGLASHPSHDLTARYLPRGAGAVLAFEIEGGEASASVFYDAVDLFSRMSHIGDARSLILHPATTTHAHLDRATRERGRITGGLLRLSIGLEEPDDLIRDLERGFAAVRVAHDVDAIDTDVRVTEGSTR